MKYFQEKEETFRRFQSQRTRKFYLAAILHALFFYRKNFTKTYINKFSFLNKQTKYFVKHANKLLIYYTARS